MDTNWQQISLSRSADAQHLTAEFQSKDQLTVKLRMVAVDGIFICEHLEIFGAPEISTNELRRIPLGWLKQRAVADEWGRNHG